MLWGTISLHSGSPCSTMRSPHTATRENLRTTMAEDPTQPKILLKKVSWIHAHSPCPNCYCFGSRYLCVSRTIGVGDGQGRLHVLQSVGFQRIRTWLTDWTELICVSLGGTSTRNFRLPQYHSHTETSLLVKQIHFLIVFPWLCSPAQDSLSALSAWWIPSRPS